MNIKNKIILLKKVESSSPFGELIVDTGSDEWVMLIAWTSSGLIDSACHTSGDKSNFSELSFGSEAGSLLRELESKTSLGMIKQNRFGFYKWFFTLVGVLVITYLVNVFIKQNS